MASLHQRGADWINTLRERSEHVVVELIRGGQRTTGLKAAVSRSVRVREDEAGSYLTEESRDFTIPRSAYGFGGVAMEPAEGDLIEDASTGETIRYMVLPIAGEPAYRWADAYGKAWRVHTKRING